jgi:hypothetical protein
VTGPAAASGSNCSCIEQELVAGNAGWCGRAQHRTGEICLHQRISKLARTAASVGLRLRELRILWQRAP